MKQDKKTFDTEFDNEMQKLENSYIHARITNIDKWCTRSIWAILIYTLCMVMLLCIGNIINSNKIDKVQEDITFMQCEKDAKKIGTVFSFVAKGNKSECQIFYND